MLMALFAVFCWACALCVFGYVAIECAVRSKAPKKIYEPETLKNYTVQKAAEYRPLQYQKKRQKGRKLENRENPVEEAKAWLKRNADYITEITKPGFDDRTVVIGNEKLRETSAQTKANIVKLLAQIYIEVQACGINDNGEIVVKIGN